MATTTGIKVVITTVPAEIWEDVVFADVEDERVLVVDTVGEVEAGLGVEVVVELDGVEVLDPEVEVEAEVDEKILKAQSAVVLVTVGTLSNIEPEVQDTEVTEYITPDVVFHHCKDSESDGEKLHGTEACAFVTVG
jgi:hypothetical protein